MKKIVYLLSVLVFGLMSSCVTGYHSTFPKEVTNNELHKVTFWGEEDMDEKYVETQALRFAGEYALNFKSSTVRVIKQELFKDVEKEVFIETQEGTVNKGRMKVVESIKVKWQSQVSFFIEPYSEENLTGTLYTADELVKLGRENEKISGTATVTACSGMSTIALGILGIIALFMK